MPLDNELVDLLLPLAAAPLALSAPVCLARSSSDSLGFRPQVEILFPYGPTPFARVAGSLAGNHFLTLTSGLEQLTDLGQKVQWEGAQDVKFELL